MTPSRARGLLLGSLLLVACGGDDDSGGDADAAPSIDATASDAAPAASPETCLDIREAAIADTGEAPADGDYTLYIDGDETKPWTAFCEGMNRADPAEYLTVDEDGNFSQLSNGTEVAVSEYRRLRIDPTALTIDPLDATFAMTTNGDLIDLPGGRADLPAGFAQFASPDNDDGPAATAGADLAGTSFALADSVLDNDGAFFCTTSDAGVPDGDWSAAADLRSFELSALNDTADATSRTVADCENLNLESDLSEAAWPLVYDP